MGGGDNGTTGGVLRRRGVEAAALGIVLAVPGFVGWDKLDGRLERLAAAQGALTVLVAERGGDVRVTRAELQALREALERLRHRLDQLERRLRPQPDRLHTAERRA